MCPYLADRLIYTRHTSDIKRVRDWFYSSNQDERKGTDHSNSIQSVVSGMLNVQRSPAS